MKFAREATALYTPQCQGVPLSCMYVSGQGSSLFWTHTLRPFYSRPIALTQEGGVWLMMCANVCVTEG